MSLWLGRTFHSGFSLTTRIDGQVWRNIKGRDKSLNPALVPTARTDLRGGERANLVFDLEWRHHDKLFGMNQLMLELATPVYQNLDGPQLKTSYQGKISLQHMF